MRATGTVQVHGRGRPTRQGPSLPLRTGRLVCTLGLTLGCGTADTVRAPEAPCAVPDCPSASGGTGGAAAGASTGGEAGASAAGAGGAGGSFGGGGAGASSGGEGSGAGGTVPVQGACAGNPCLNGGVCMLRGDAALCQCLPGWGGERCDLREPPQPDPDCRLPDTLPLPGPVVWREVGEGAADDLMMMRQSRSGYWYEAYRGGEVRVVPPDGVRAAEPLLVVPAATEGEMGLLGLALHPGFDTQPYLYLYYTTLDGEGGTGVLRIDRYRVQDAGATPTISAGSRTEIFRADRGHSRPFHVGGTLEFDPLASGAHLYFASGDGAGSSDNCEPPQGASGPCVSLNAASPHGKLLRFDVTDPDLSQYEPELVGVGLRNPFRWSFDSQTGDLWLADVGESRFEELNRVPAGDIPRAGQAPLNFGWPCFEGFAPFAAGSVCAQLGESVRPIHVYSQAVGVSVIGGRVYRGELLPDAAGSYHFNDVFPQDGSRSWQLVANQDQDPEDPEDDFVRVETGAGSFVAYAEDACRELYAITLGGAIFRLGSGGSALEP